MKPKTKTKPNTPPKEKRIAATPKKRSRNKRPQATEASEVAGLPRPIQFAKPGQIVDPDIEDATEIVEFLELFKQLADPRTHKPAKLISIKIPEPLLATFRFKAERENKRYQTKIKELMLDYVRGRIKLID